MINEANHEKHLALHKLQQSGVFFMIRNKENDAVWITIASSAGVGFASLRGIVLFFAQTGKISWLGVVLASAIFGLLCGSVCRMTRKMTVNGIFGVYRHWFGERMARVLGGLHGVAGALTIVMMLNVAGKMMQLALMCNHAYGIGILIAVFGALLLNWGGKRSLLIASRILLSISFLLMLALRIDPRSALDRVNYETTLELENSVIASICLALEFALINATIAANSVVESALCARSATTFGLKCAVGMFAMLAVSNSAILSGGEKLCSQWLPTVILAARWGKTGFALSLLVTYVGAVMTLSAMMRLLFGKREKVCRKHVLNYEKRSK